jgi:hypothetical protein
LRLVNMIRKANMVKENKGRMSSFAVGTTSVEKTLSVLQACKVTNHLLFSSQASSCFNSSMKDKIDWAIEVISSNKLYSITVNVSGKEGSGDDAANSIATQVKGWLSLCTVDGGTDQKSLKNSEIDKFLLSHAKRTAIANKNNDDDDGSAVTPNDAISDVRPLSLGRDIFFIFFPSLFVGFL